MFEHFQNLNILPHLYLLLRLSGTVRCERSPGPITGALLYQIRVRRIHSPGCDTVVRRDPGDARDEVRLLLGVEHVRRLGKGGLLLLLREVLLLLLLEELELCGTGCGGLSLLRSEQLLKKMEKVNIKTNTIDVMM